MKPADERLPASLWCLTAAALLCVDARYSWFFGLSWHDAADTRSRSRRAQRDGVVVTSVDEYQRGLATANPLRQERDTAATLSKE
jgi:hypothetical protein